MYPTSCTFTRVLYGLLVVGLYIYPNYCNKTFCALYLNYASLSALLKVTIIVQLMCCLIYCPLLV